MEQDNVYTRITVTKASDKDNSINAGQYPSFVVNLSNSITGVSSVDLGDAITRSENAANAAKTSQTEAKKSENAAKASADASATSLANIKDSEAKAKASADAAKASETAAKASQGAAKTSETNAKESETAAANSAAMIKDEVEQTAANAVAAKKSEDAAKASQAAAKTSETNAAASAAAAKTSETNAKGSETAAKTAETGAKTAETGAKTAQTEAGKSATAAKTSETNAKTSETTASGSASSAKTSETNAKASETAAAGSASAAKTSETSAAGSATASETSNKASATSAAAAKASQEAALASETAAKTSETNAKTSETNAKTSETNAKTSENAAKLANSNAQSAQQSAQMNQQATIAAMDAAQKSEEAAKASEEAASSSATAADASDTSARGHATSADNSAKRASASENAAQKSAQDANKSASEAAGYRNAAQDANRGASASATEAATSASNAAASASSSQESATAAQEANESVQSAKVSIEDSEATASQAAIDAANSALEAKEAEQGAIEAAGNIPSISNTDKRYTKVRTPILDGTDILEYFKTAKTGFYFSTKNVVNALDIDSDVNYVWTNGRDDVSTEGVETQYGILTAYTYTGKMYMKVLNKGLWNGTRDVVVTAAGGTTFEDLVVQKSSANRLKMVVGATQRENRISFHHGLSTHDGNMTGYVGYAGGSERFFVTNELKKVSLELSDKGYIIIGNFQSPIATERSLGGSSFFPRGIVNWSSTPPSYNDGSGMYKVGQGVNDPAIIQFASQDDKMYASALQLRFTRAASGSLKYRIAGFNSFDFPMGWVDIVTQITGKQNYRDDNAVFGAGTNTDAVKFAMPNTGTMIQTKFAENRKGQIFIGENGSLKSRWVAETGKGGDIAWIDILDSKNTTKDPNGFIKVASPIVKVFSNHCITNDESEGVTYEKLGTGHYLVKGTLGFNSDGAWGINGGVVVPKDENDQPIMWVKTKVLKDGNIEIKTFHRQHGDAPVPFQNFRIKSVVGETIEYYEDGDVVDIPDNTWLDLRVQMPEDSIYNQKRKAMELENEKIEADRVAALEAERAEELLLIEETKKRIQEDGWTVPEPVEEIRE